VNPAIEFRRADSVAEACALLADSEDVRVVSGGTALTILMRQGLVRPNLLVGVSRIAQLRHIEVNEPDAVLHLGAAVPMRVTEQHPALIQRWPVLAETLRLVATPRIRNMATLGGALSHADPAQDPPVVLVALGARVLVAGRDSERVVAAADFFVDYYETVLQSGEMVVGVEVPALDSAVGSIFLKYTPARSRTMPPSQRAQLWSWTRRAFADRRAWCSVRLARRRSWWMSPRRSPASR
jgi:aerobic carbon-monoxide dehydrogenase medium subunit